MLTYHDILARCALRINALVGTDAPELQTTYSTRPLTDEMFQSSVFPFNAIRDAIIDAEGVMARAIGLSADRSLRAALFSRSGPYNSGDPLDSVDIFGSPIVGNLGAVTDSNTPSLVYTRMPVPVLRNRLLTTGVYLVNPHYYALAGDLILHTGTSTVHIECCAYSAEDQTAAFDRDDPLLLPDSLADGYELGALAQLIRDDEFMAQGAQFAQGFAAILATIPPAVMEQEAA